jgi:hypothetical protein
MHPADAKSRAADTCVRFPDSMFILEFIVECFFFTVCGWIGHLVVKLVTLGRVDLDWDSGSESVITAWIGFFFLLLVGGVIAWIIRT